MLIYPKPTIREIFRAHYVIPAGQRELKWNSACAKDVYESLLGHFNKFKDIADRTENYYNYDFPSASVIPRSQPGYSVYYDIWDGQQRMSSLTLFFCAIRDYLKSKSCESLSGHIMSVNNIIKGPRTINNTLVQESVRVTREISVHSGCLFETITAADKYTIQEAKEYSCYDDHDKSTASQYITYAINLETDFNNPLDVMEFFYWILDNARMTLDSYSDKVDPISIYIRINGGGIKLDNFDLLSAACIEGVTSNSDKSLIASLWKKASMSIHAIGRVSWSKNAFLRYFTQSEYCTELTDSSIRAWYAREINSTIRKKNPIDFSRTVAKQAELFYNIARGRDFEGDPCNPIMNIDFLSSSNIQHAIPLMTASKYLNKDFFKEVAQALETAFALIGSDRKALQQQLFKLSDFIRLEKDISVSQDYLKSWLNKLVEDNFFEFENSVITGSILSRNKYYIAKIASYCSGDTDGCLKSFMKNRHFEHIHPSSPKQANSNSAYVNYLGNLTVLEQSLNTSIKNNAFELKLPAYASSDVKITRRIASVSLSKFRTVVELNLHPYSYWNDGTIIQRTVEMYKILLEALGIKAKPSLTISSLVNIQELAI